MTQNAEQFLANELQDAAEGRRPRSGEYLRTPPVVSSLGGQGSQNWPIMGASIAYSQGGKGKRDELLDYFAKSRTCFMGTEFGLGTYCLWGFALPGALVHKAARANGHTDVEAAALEWQRVFWGIVRESTAPDGTILTVGMRASPWHDPNQIATWLGWTRAMALSEDEGRWRAASKPLGLGMEQSFIPPTARALRASLAAGMAPGEIPDFGSMAPLHVLSGDGFRAVWLDRNVNGNTPPLAAAAWVNGAVTYLPSGVDRVRQKFDEISVTRDAAGLHYSSSLYGTGTIELPSGGTEVVYGAGGGLIVGEPVVVAGEPSPADGVDLARAADLIASLKVPPRQAGEQRRLVAELQGSPSRPLTAIADAVAQLGIGENQPQAPAWRTAIAILRGEA